MVEVRIHMVHDAQVFEEVTAFGTLTWRLICGCGWTEKGYGPDDCETKAMDHMRRVPDVTLVLPVTIPGRHGW